MAGLNRVWIRDQKSIWISLKSRVELLATRSNFGSCYHIPKGANEIRPPFSPLKGHVVAAVCCIMSWKYFERTIHIFNYLRFYMISSLDIIYEHSHSCLCKKNLVKTQGDENNNDLSEVISSHCGLLTTAQGDQILTLPINSSTTRLLFWVQLLCDWHRKFQFWYFQQQRIGIWFFLTVIRALSFCGYFCFYEIWVTDWRQWKNGIFLDQNKLLQGW